MESQVEKNFQKGQSYPWANWYVTQDKNWKLIAQVSSVEAIGGLDQGCIRELWRQKPN